MSLDADVILSHRHSQIGRGDPLAESALQPATRPSGSSGTVTATVWLMRVGEMTIE
jgi:hypothetical protein